MEGETVVMKTVVLSVCCERLFLDMCTGYFCYSFSLLLKDLKIHVPFNTHGIDINFLTHSSNYNAKI